MSPRKMIPNDTNLERLYMWWVDLVLSFTLWVHNILYVKYMVPYVVLFWHLAYIQWFFIMAGLATGFVPLGNGFYSPQFLGMLAATGLASGSAYFESKRIRWVLTRFYRNLGPMFRRRLRKATGLNKDGTEEVMNELNGVLDRFLVRAEGRKSLTSEEVKAMLRESISPLDPAVESVLPEVSPSTPLR